MFYTNTCSPVKISATIPSQGVDSNPHGEQTEEELRQELEAEAESESAEQEELDRQEREAD